jgi:hypothetical protein
LINGGWSLHAPGGIFGALGSALGTGISAI